MYLELKVTLLIILNRMVSFRLVYVSIRTPFVKLHCINTYVTDECEVMSKQKLDNLIWNFAFIGFSIMTHHF